MKHILVPSRHRLSLTILVIFLFLATLLATPLQAQPTASHQDQLQTVAPTIDDASTANPNEQEPPFDPPSPREWVGLEVELITPGTVGAKLGMQTTITVKIHNQGNIDAQDVTVTLEGVNDLVATPQHITTIKAGKTRTVNLKAEVLGRFASPLPFAVRATAENNPQPTIEHSSLTFSPLHAQNYFNNFQHIRLLRERLAHNTSAAEQGTLLEFEILQDWQPDLPLEADLTSLFAEYSADGVQLKLYYAPVSPDGEVQPGNFIATAFDQEADILHFTPPGPGIYSLAVAFGEFSESETPEGWTPTYHPPEVSAFTGAVTHSYAMLTPPGPAGLQPTLGLVYNSGTANGIASKYQGDPAGFGWVLTARVDVAQTLTTCHGNDLCQAEIDLDGDKNTIGHYNQYKLTFFGQGHELIHTDGRESNGEPGRYYAAGYAGLYVELCKEPFSAACTFQGTDIEASQRSKVYWLIKSPSNTSYRLGYTANSEQAVRSITGNGITNPALKWRLDLATDRFGNEMAYTYIESEYEDTNLPPDQIRNLGAETSYLKSITYDNNEIEFGYEETGWNYGPVSTMSVSWQTQFLNTVQIFEDGDRLRLYKLDYNWQRHGQPMDGDDPHEPPIDNQSSWCRVYEYPEWGDARTFYSTHLLIGITEFDSSGELSRVTGRQDVSFGYDFAGTANLNPEGTPDDIRFCYPYLTAFDTLYGPGSDISTPTVTYAHSGTRDYQPEDSDYKDPRLDLFMHTVDRQTALSGWADDAPDQDTYYEYKIEDAYYLGIEDSFQGFGRATICEDGPCDGSNWLRQRVLVFLGYSYAENESTLTGKLTQRATNDIGENRALSEGNTWEMLSGGNVNARHPVLTSATSTDERNGGSATLRTDYAYDIYGNQLEVVEYGADLSGSNPVRTTVSTFEPNAEIDEDFWLVNLPWRVTVWDGPGMGTDDDIVARMRYRYDNDPQGQAPEEGKLTEEDTLVCEAWQGTAPNQTCTSLVWATTTYKYGGIGGGGGLDWQRTHRVDPNGVWQSTFWKDSTLVDSTMDAIGTTTYTYEDDNTPWLLTQIEQPNGAKTAYIYDTFGRLTDTRDPDPTTGGATIIGRSYIYQDDADPFHIEVQDLDPTSGNWHTRTFYDAQGRQLQQRTWGISSDFYVAITDIEYDDLGRPACDIMTLAGAEGNHGFNPDLRCDERDHVATEYDALDDVLKVTGPDGHATTTQYGNRQRQVTDANTHTTTYTNDPLGRLVSVQQPAPEGGPGHTTTYEYDLADNLTRVNGANNANTIISYNLRGQKLYMNDPNMGVWEYAYDDGSRLVRQTDANDQLFCFYYNDANQLTDKTLADIAGCNDDNSKPPGPGESETILASYTYHEQGPGLGLVHETSYGGNNKDTTSYDYRGRVTDVTRLVEGLQFNRQMSYDLQDRPTRTDYPNGDATVIRYDGQFPDGLSSTVGGSTSDVITDLQHTQRGDLERIFRPNNLPYSAFDYYTEPNGNYRLKTLRHEQFSSSWLLYSYEYDVVGNLTRQETTLNDVDFEDEDYAYDALNRLETAGTGEFDIPDPDPDPTDYQYTYAYGNGGNISTRTSPIADNWTYRYYDDDPNHKHALKSILDQDQKEIASFDYDNNGNMISRSIGEVDYIQEWGVENRLTSVTEAGQSTTFQYDADGQRVFTELPDGTKIYTPWPDYETEETTGRSVQRVTYTLAGRTVGVEVKNHPDVEKRGRFYLFANHLGSVVAVTDSSGQLQADFILYEPFGDYRDTPPDETNPDITDRGFTNQKHNNDLKLIYYGARYYMPGIGRFLSPDTIVPNPAYPQSLNRYTYALNNPVKYSDPSGHFPWDLTIDIISFGLSLNDYRNEPSWGNAGWLALDTFSLLPAVPALGSIHHGAKVVNYTDTVVDATKFIPAGISDETGKAIGYWKELSESALDKDWAKYQAYVTGAEGMDFSFKGVDFDGVFSSVDGDKADIILIDAKNWGSGKNSFSSILNQYDWAKNSPLKEARRQLGAIQGTGAKIQWHVADEQAANILRNLFDEYKIFGIDVRYTPWQ